MAQNFWPCADNTARFHCANNFLFYRVHSNKLLNDVSYRSLPFVRFASSASSSARQTHFSFIKYGISEWGWFPLLLAFQFRMLFTIYNLIINALTYQTWSASKTTRWHCQYLTSIDFLIWIAIDIIFDYASSCLQNRRKNFTRGV